MLFLPEVNDELTEAWHAPSCCLSTFLILPPSPLLIALKKKGMPSHLPGRFAKRFTAAQKLSHVMHHFLPKHSSTVELGYLLQFAQRLASEVLFTFLYLTTMLTFSSLKCKLLAKGALETVPLVSSESAFFTAATSLFPKKMAAQKLLAAP